MKRTFSTIYAIFVLLVLLGVMGIFGLKLYNLRASRMENFTVSTKDYVQVLTESISERPGIDVEVETAEAMLNQDSSLMAIQIYSADSGLRFSVVKPPLSSMRSMAIVESSALEKGLSKLRFQVVRQPIQIEQMPGLEAHFVGVTLTSTELQSNLLVILITVSGLFILTLVLIFTNPRKKHIENTDEKNFHASDASLTDFKEDFSATELPLDFDDAPIFPDFDEEDRLDETDLLDSRPEMGTSIPFDEDLPNLDNLSKTETDTYAKSDFLDCLKQDLEKTTSLNQNLSVLVFQTREEAKPGIQKAFGFQQSLFQLAKDRFGVIALGKDLDQSIAIAESIISSEVHTMRIGITSRNGRIISANHLLYEVEKALSKTHLSQSIVAFRSDPEKYREYYRNKDA